MLTGTCALSCIILNRRPPPLLKPLFHNRRVFLFKVSRLFRAAAYFGIREAFASRHQRRQPPVGCRRRSVKRVKRGDIYFADLDPVIGSEQGGRRPVLIIQNDLGNRFSPTVIILPLTSRTGKAPLRTHVPLSPPQGGVRKPSIILCEQVRTLEKSRLSIRLGALTPEKMVLVERALAAAVGTEAEGEEAEELS